MRLAKYSVLIFTLSFSGLATADDVMCKDLFLTRIQQAQVRRENRVTKAIRAFQQGKVDTTSLRQEVKYVVTAEQLASYLPILENHFGSRFKNRDKAPEGLLNITSTRYMTIGKFFQNEKQLSAKVRFRKYFTRSQSDTQWRNLQVHPDLVDRSWLELKIQHPEFDNTVFKPRLQILDKDIEKLVTEKYFDYKDGIVKRLYEINPGKEDDIKKFIDYFDALYSSPDSKVENMLAQTAYERTSYSIKLKNPDKPNETIDIQITVDQNIKLTRLKDGKTFNVYKPHEVVVEVKIPVAYAKLTPANMIEVPELSEIKDLIEMLDTHHVMDYPKNRGKMSKIDKKNDNQKDRDLDDDWE